MASGPQNGLRFLVKPYSTNQGAKSGKLRRRGIERVDAREDGAAHVMKNFGGNRSEQQAAECAKPSGRHHDEVYAVALRNPVNDGGGDPSSTIARHLMSGNCSRTNV